MIKVVPKTSCNFSSHWGKSLSHFPVCRCTVTRGFFLPPLLRMQGKDKTTLVQRAPLPSHFTTVSKLTSSSSSTMLLYWKWDRKSPWSDSSTKGWAGDIAPPSCLAFSCTKGKVYHSKSASCTSSMESWIHVQLSTYSLFCNGIIWARAAVEKDAALLGWPSIITEKMWWWDLPNISFISNLL